MAVALVAGNLSQWALATFATGAIRGLCFLGSGPSTGIWAGQGKRAAERIADAEFTSLYAKGKFIQSASAIIDAEFAADRAELIEALRVLAKVFQSFCNDVGNHHESYQREHIASAEAIVAKHTK
jgi:hypothetical protein